MKDLIQFSDFQKLDIRAGKIITCDFFPEARKTAYKLTIDFGSEIGIKTSSAQITALYHPEDLLGKLIVAIINLPAKQIGPFMSQVLVLGFPDGNGHVVLAVPDNQSVFPGSRLL